MSVFFVVAWAVVLTCFLVIPIVASKEVRQRWYRALRYCDWKTTTAAQLDTNAVATNDQAPETEQFHYRLSSEQEDEIREAFLVERLRSFTTTLRTSDIQLSTPESAVIPRATALALTPDVSHLEAETEDNEIREDVDYAKRRGKYTHGYESSDDDCSLDGKSNVQVEELFAADHSGHVSVPLPGLSLSAIDDGLKSTTSTDAVAIAATSTCTTTAHAKEAFSKRRIPNGCAICLCTFEAGDKVTWSSNQDCKHVFHDECVLNWLQISGRRHLRRRRREEQRNGNQVLAYAVDPLVKIINFPMLCPCCRQVFVVATEDEDQDNKDNSNPLRQTVPSTTTTVSEASSSAESVGDEASSTGDVEHGVAALVDEATHNTILAIPAGVGSDEGV